VLIIQNLLNKFGRVEVRRFQFEDSSRMREALADVKVLYNTYWMGAASALTMRA
jgi:hypothetical protein